MLKKIKVAITVLTVLLAISVVSLIGIVTYNYFCGQVATAVAPDNWIEPNRKEKTAKHGKNGTETDTPQIPDIVQTKADVLYFHFLNADENKPFKVTNMFPGDAITQYYRIRVTHTGKVNLRFRADVREGYEKLAEVLQCRVTLLTTGEVLYDGLMRDMPEEVVHPMPGSSTRTDEVYYEITAYLDTSVGNDYQLQTLMADFRWWVEETSNLGIPQTGDDGVLPYAVGALISLFFIILLCKTRKKEDAENAG